MAESILTLALFLFYCSQQPAPVSIMPTLMPAPVMLSLVFTSNAPVSIPTPTGTLSGMTQNNTSALHMSNNADTCVAIKCLGLLQVHNNQKRPHPNDTYGGYTLFYDCMRSTQHPTVVPSRRRWLHMDLSAGLGVDTNRILARSPFNMYPPWEGLDKKARPEAGCTRGSARLLCCPLAR